MGKRLHVLICLRFDYGLSLLIGVNLLTCNLLVNHLHVTSQSLSYICPIVFMQVEREYSFLDFIFGGLQINFTVGKSHSSLAMPAKLKVFKNLLLQLFWDQFKPFALFGVGNAVLIPNTGQIIGIVLPGITLP